MEKRAINPWTWQDALGFAQAMEVGPAKKTLVCSGQTSVDAKGQPLHEGDMAGQLTQAIANLETVLLAGGFDLTDVRAAQLLHDRRRRVHAGCGGGWARAACGVELSPGVDAARGRAIVSPGDHGGDRGDGDEDEVEAAGFHRNCRRH